MNIETILQFSHQCNDQMKKKCYAKKPKLVLEHKFERKKCNAF